MTTANNSRQIRLIIDCLVEVPETDYPEVANEVIQYIHSHMAEFSDALNEFLEQREDAAPTTVDRARVLDSVLGYETRRWVQRHCET
ncbi:hypothetical protein [Nocardia sp. alder85J]|uniref:hypothetical protein n=1 Tax=Nocardia sp. alder85J TaxID=2862949 RepID=UPI001CD1E76C|nr:hypothetical protein [Nocardia sp. alder85J]MCX4098050.1 hypothetical protein [Nocardia sp. alder85J]